MKLTAFVITRGRPHMLAACVGSALADLPADGELRVIVNGSDPRTESGLAGQRDPRLHWSVRSRQSRALCRNQAFEEARGEILHFLDDDVEVPRGLFREVLLRFQGDPELVVLGGPNLTPPGSPWKERLFGAVMTSPFAAPFVFRRYASGGVDRVGHEHQLILCNLALRRSRIPSDLRFRSLRSNEENLFLFHCVRLGLGLRVSSDCFVYHRRRSTFSGFFSQVFSYGYGRAQQTYHSPRSLHPAFLMPGLAVAFAPLCLARCPRVLTVYFGLSALGALLSREVRRLGAHGWCLATLLTAVVHGAYGLGFWSACWGGWKNVRNPLRRHGLRRTISRWGIGHVT